MRIIYFFTGLLIFLYSQAYSAESDGREIVEPSYLIASALNQISPLSSVNPASLTDPTIWQVNSSFQYKKYYKERTKDWQSVIAVTSDTTETGLPMLDTISSDTVPGRYLLRSTPQDKAGNLEPFHIYISQEYIRNFSVPRPVLFRIYGGGNEESFLEELHLFDPIYLYAELGGVTVTIKGEQLRSGATSRIDAENFPGQLYSDYLRIFKYLQETNIAPFPLLREGTKAILVGHSFGGFVCTSLATTELLYDEGLCLNSLFDGYISLAGIYDQAMRAFQKYIGDHQGSRALYDQEGTQRPLGDMKCGSAQQDWYYFCENFRTNSAYNQRVSPAYQLHRLKKPLLAIHGMMDGNVFPHQLAKLLEESRRVGKSDLIQAHFMDHVSHQMQKYVINLSEDTVYHNFDPHNLNPEQPEAIQFMLNRYVFNFIDQISTNRFSPAFPDISHFQLAFDRPDYVFVQAAVGAQAMMVSTILNNKYYPLKETVDLYYKLGRSTTKEEFLTLFEDNIKHADIQSLGFLAFGDQHFDLTERVGERVKMSRDLPSHPQGIYKEEFLIQLKKEPDRLWAEFKRLCL